MAERKMKHLWMVEDRKGPNGEARSYWTKIGVAFENRDGSWDLQLSALPLTGRLQLRDPAIPTGATDVEHV